MNGDEWLGCWVMASLFVGFLQGLLHKDVKAAYSNTPGPLAAIIFPMVGLVGYAAWGMINLGVHCRKNIIEGN